MAVLGIAVLLVTIAANAAESVANFARAKFVVANMAQVRVPESMLPLLGACKGAGAIGLALGLAGVTSLGIAAAAGLIVFFVIAVGVHIRTGVLHNIAFPLGFLALSAASLGAMLAY
ncbi:DoxX family protein [Nocardia jejuensis]|uniref:DoxX family protein n=1 Tax=Nocardia jejuensis TaxID=328049 RepID=UPI000836280D|nr:DoxX family protein [Nocardia jejuensis]